MALELRSSLSPWQRSTKTTADSHARLLRLPGIVSADVPDVALEVATGEGAATVRLVFDVEKHLCAGLLRARIDCIGIGHDKRRASSLSATNLIGLLHEPTVVIVVNRSQHNHPAV